MQVHGISGVCRRRGFIITTKKDRASKAASDLVKRRFFASRPNQPWESDIAYFPTWEGFTNLATVLDVLSRKIVGWAVINQMTSDVVTNAHIMALTACNPGRSVIH
jgi:putative transposase